MSRLAAMGRYRITGSQGTTVRLLSTLQGHSPKNVSLTLGEREKYILLLDVDEAAANVLEEISRVHSDERTFSIRLMSIEIRHPLLQRAYLDVSRLKTAFREAGIRQTSLFQQISESGNLQAVTTHTLSEQQLELRITTELQHCLDKAVTYRVYKCVRTGRKAPIHTITLTPTPRIRAKTQTRVWQIARTLADALSS